MKRIFASLFLLCVLPFHPSWAEAPAADGPPPAAKINAAQRKEIVDVLTRKLQDNYIFPDVAEKLVNALRAKNAKGGYNDADDVEKLAAALSRDLNKLGRDAHFEVLFDPEFIARADESARSSDPKQRRVPSPEEVAEGKQIAAKFGYGIQRIERLPGNIGYLELRNFGPTELVGAAYTSAISLLAGTDAFILDLRRNSGGEPTSVAHLLSHFFSEGDERHLNDIYDRPKNTTRQYWTVPGISVRYTKPVYVLTSGRTFSGGEECAYDLQTQERAILIGEVTGGGANPGDMFPLAHGLAAFIPTGRSINPITKTDWEKVGVKPDIEVAAEQALQVAHAAAVKALLQTSSNPRERADLENLLTQIEKDELPKPDYQRRH